jgi:asparagine synthase (glutamine-hydrolysing)
MAHRGPDGAGVCSWNVNGIHVQLAHTRLAINDLSPAGEQPVYDESERLAMIFNGEIYNYPKLRTLCEDRGHTMRSHMDGEVIIHLFEDEGLDAFKRLNGIFALAIADRESGQVVLARDPLGVKPLFYSIEQSGRLTFASELRTLAHAGGGVTEYDKVAMAQFLTFLWVPAPRTPFAGVRSLRPGETLIWSPDGVTVRAYGEPVFSTVPGRSVDVAATVNLARSHVTDAAHRQLLSDVPIGLMVSGGVDSGLLWWSTHEALERAFTITWDPSSDSEGLNEEVENVRHLQQRLGTHVQEVPGGEVAMEVLPRAGDLFADPAYALASEIAKHARAANIPVLLSGQGGDELFGGYRRHVVARVLERVALGRMGRSAASALARAPLRNVNVEYAARLARALSEKDPFRGYMQLSTYSESVDRARALECDEREVSDDVVWQEHREFYESLPQEMSFTRKVMALDLAVYMPGLGLAYVDRAGMEHGVEIRVPWLDLELVRWASKLPVEYLVRRGTNKWLTRRVAREVLGERYASAPKRGFGAPSSTIAASAWAGERGFRQSVYFSLATRLLDQHRETVGKELVRTAAAARA